jgi:hypothetical protein
MGEGGNVSVLAHHHASTNDLQLLNGHKASVGSVKGWMDIIVQLTMPPL